MQRLRLLLGINLFWLALSVLSDGFNTLVLPSHLLATSDVASSATQLGLITFAGLMLGMVVQPVAGLFSDRLRPRWGRRGTLAVGVAAILLSLALFGAVQHLLFVFVAYLLIQVAGSVAQAAQQGFIPDLVRRELRGTASGFKSFMDLGGALLAFVVLGGLLAGGETAPALVAIGVIVLIAFLLTAALVREPARGDAPTPVQVSLRRAFSLDLQEHRAFVWLVVSRWLFLLGTYAVGRFLLLFVAERLGLDAGQAAQEAGGLLAALTLIAILAAPPAGWLADRVGRVPLMVMGALLSAAGALLLIWSNSSSTILLFGSLMGLGSAAFAGANWALTADLVPESEAARFFALANFGTAGAAAAAGLFGPLVEWAERFSPGAGFATLFSGATVAFLLSVFALWRLVEVGSEQTQMTPIAARSSSQGVEGRADG